MENALCFSHTWNVFSLPINVVSINVTKIKEAVSSFFKSVCMTILSTLTLAERTLHNENNSINGTQVTRCFHRTQFNCKQRLYYFVLSTVVLAMQRQNDVCCFFPSLWRIACFCICVCQMQMHIQCFIKGPKYYVFLCMLAYVVIIELAIKQRTREREMKDESIYSGNHLVNRPSFIIHTNQTINHKLSTVELLHSILRERESQRLVDIIHMKTKQLYTVNHKGAGFHKARVSN